MGPKSKTPRKKRTSSSESPRVRLRRLDDASDASPQYEVCSDPMARDIRHAARIPMPMDVVQAEDSKEDTIEMPLEPHGHPSSWSVDQVGQWLLSMELPRVVAIFRGQAINGRALLQLNEADLKEMQLLIGHRKPILEFLEAQHPRPSAAVGVPAMPSIPMVAPIAAPMPRFGNISDIPEYSGRPSDIPISDWVNRVRAIASLPNPPWTVNETMNALRLRLKGQAMVFLDQICLTPITLGP